MNYYNLGIFAGIAFALILFYLLKRFGKYERPEYDERQVAAQGKCYKYAFFALLASVGSLAILDLFEIAPFIDLPNAIFFSIVISAGVFVLTGIHEDCYYGLNDSPRKTMTIGIVIAVANIIPTVSFIIDGEFLQNGKGFASLLCAVLWIVVIVYTYIHNRGKKTEEDEE